jgi:hypothetical protein
MIADTIETYNSNEFICSSFSILIIFKINKSMNSIICSKSNIINIGNTFVTAMQHIKKENYLCCTFDYCFLIFDRNTRSFKLKVTNKAYSYIPV